MTRQTVISSLVIAIAIASSPLAHSQQMIAPKVPHPIELQQVAPDLFFLNDYDSSNADSSSRTKACSLSTRVNIRVTVKTL